MLRVIQTRQAFRLSFLAALAGPILLCSAASAEDDSNTDPGAYMAVTSDCVACHTAPGGKPFAGGLAMKTPLGTMYSTNITPSKTYGIGEYSEADFSRAVRKGIRKDGSNLYPAMPYTAYSYMTDQDIHDLYLYFMKSVQPVESAPPKTALPFPMNIRSSMLFWNILFRNNTTYQPDPSRSAEWNRGAYLAQGPAHCGTCHTPRGFLMQEEASQALGGGSLGSWYAPNITSDKISGIGNWSQDEIKTYLKSGHIDGLAQAAGGMGEAVEHSFQHLTEADLNALATYLASTQPVRDPADGNLSRFALGQPVSSADRVRGDQPIRSEDNPDISGAELFMGNCASCHNYKAQGSRDGYYPSLWHNSVTGASNPDNLIATILFGIDRHVAGAQAFMPGFGEKKTDAVQLNDEEIAKLTKYVFDTYGRPQVSVSPAQVATIRQGGPKSPLLVLSRIGMAGGAIVIALGCFWLLRTFRK
ncbi:cytochrome c [Novacetimonas hansenii]|uniref:Cytochrome c n=3 Tax=Novacetimonas hansenii TaxID=436 RepID=A0ABQ0SIY7_NOVHA|nr:cytochrome-c oxidase protein [Novacetimonas hansenii ATCC 23769]GEC65259.1 cytochrome c [Novacetimonas hansenii]